MLAIQNCYYLISYTDNDVKFNYRKFNGREEILCLFCGLFEKFHLIAFYIFTSFR